MVTSLTLAMTAMTSNDKIYKRSRKELAVLPTSLKLWQILFKIFEMFLDQHNLYRDQRFLESQIYGSILISRKNQGLLAVSVWSNTAIIKLKSTLLDSFLIAEYICRVPGGIEVFLCDKTNVRC